jgi:hypothetical protein
MNDGTSIVRAQSNVFESALRPGCSNRHLQNLDENIFTFIVNREHTIVTARLFVLSFAVGGLWVVHPL